MEIGRLFDTQFWYNGLFMCKRREPQAHTTHSLRLVFDLNLKVETTHLLQEHTVKYRYRLGVVKMYIERLGLC